MTEQMMRLGYENEGKPRKWTGTGNQQVVEMKQMENSDEDSRLLTRTSS